MAIAISPSELQKTLEDKIPPGTVAGIVDPTGHFIARTVRPGEMIGKLATSYVQDAIRTGKKAGLYYSITHEGFKSYTAFYTSPVSGWSTHIAVSASLIDSPRLWFYVLLILSIAIALVLATGVIVYLLKDFETVASARFAAIVEGSEDAIVSKNLDGIINSWNAGAEKIFGYKAEEAIGQHISLIIPHDRMDEEKNIISKIKSGERITHYETIRRKKDGTLVDLSITVSPVKNESGKIIGASKVARDVSERKATETQLAEERKTLEILNRLAPALASTLDLESLVQKATDEATKVTGAAFGAFFYNAISDEGKAYLLYTLAGAPKEAFEHLGMPRATAIFGPTFRGEGTVILDDVTSDPRYGKNSPHRGMPAGHLPVRSYLAVPVTSRSGEVIGGLFFGHPDPGIFKERDARVVEGIAALAAVGIDNARLYEEVRRGRIQAEEASKAKTDFLATMSHEIRTPMNAIIGLSSILSMSEPLTVKQKEFVKTLQSSADSLLHLINDLLDISRIEARSIQFEKVPFSLQQLIQEVVSMMNVRASEKGIKLTVEAGQGIHNQHFMGDPTRMRQIISNLVGNAIKFTEEGRVTIKLSAEHANEPDVEKISIAVEDTGIGIHEDKLDAIFEKFTQADTSINRKYGGSGLGLSITQRLVHAMQGSIQVESEEGKGSTFTVKIPLALARNSKQRNADNAEKDTQETQKSGHVILLVEDHEPNVLVAGSFLEMLGYSYEVAENGMEALEKIRTQRYSAILMDVQMPGMNGFEATRLIRMFEKTEGYKKMPIIGVTAHAMSGDRERCLSEGMDEYMSKPFDLIELRSKLNKFLKPLKS